MTAARCLVADPPWLFDDALPGARGAAHRYPCMAVEEICAFPLPPLARDCTLFLWRTAALQLDALHVVKEWGFQLKSELVWEKHSRSGESDHMGLGRIVRGSHEVCLIATRGSPKVLRHDVLSRFAAPVGRHSAKPDRFYEIVEALYRGPFVELFGRRQRTNWTVLGNQVPR